jgi:hypothetical protein
MHARGHPQTDDSDSVLLVLCSIQPIQYPSSPAFLHAMPLCLHLQSVKHDHLCLGHDRKMRQLVSCFDDKHCVLHTEITKVRDAMQDESLDLQ